MMFYHFDFVFLGDRQSKDFTGSLLTPENDEKHRDSITSLTESACDDLAKTFSKRIDEMDLSHIDSSESPSEENGPPNQTINSAPDEGSEKPTDLPSSPRVIHKSFTENYLGIKEGNGISRSMTDIGTEYLKVDQESGLHGEITLRKNLSSFSGGCLLFKLE